MKKILITGASRGIGKAIALLLKDVDFYEIITLSSSGKYSDYTLDLSNEEDLAIASNIECDVLINNAGILSDNIDKSLDVNLKAVMCLTKINHQRMEKGLIINIGSNASIMPINIPRVPQEYIVTKAAIKRYSELLSDTKKPNIKICHMSLDYVDTDMTSYIPEKLRRSFLKPLDIANIVKWIIETPSHISISDITIRGVKI